MPVLELDDGTRLHSTQGVWTYLEAAYPDPPLMGRTPAERGRVADLEWRVEMEGFLAVGETLRNSAKGMANRALTGPNNFAQIPELAERGRQRIPIFFDTLERILSDSEYVAGDAYSVADITAFVAVQFAAWVKLELDADKHKNALRWYEAIKARPSSAL